jgi:hypothetical protein
MEDLRNIRELGSDDVGEEVDFIHNPFDYLRTAFNEQYDI